MVYLFFPAFISLFFEQGEAQDFLFIATERYKFCVLQWDAETSELITRFKLEYINYNFLVILLIDVNELLVPDNNFWSGIYASSCFLFFDT